jgi:tRNA-dihydrouridine synthase
LRIPVVANGGIETFQDVALAFEETGADAVMSSGILIYHALWRNSANSSSFFFFFFFHAEGLLENPAVFSETQPDMMTLADLYLQKCERYPCPDKFIRKHLFDLLFRRYYFHNLMQL